MDFAYFDLGDAHSGDEQADTPHTWLEAVVPALVEAGRALTKLLRTPGQAPNLAITGDSGPVGADDFRRSERYHEGKWELLVVPEAGHFVHREAPEVVAEKILGFLEENIGAP